MKLSLLQVDIWEALKCQRPLTPNYGTNLYGGIGMDEETQQFQR